MLKAILWKNGGTWLVTRKLILSGTEAQLSVERPFSGRMEAPGQLSGNCFNLGLKLSLSAERPFSGIMEAPGQLLGISVWD